MIKMRCSVPHCVNSAKETSNNHGVTFHVFPKDPIACNTWLEALDMCGWEPKECSAICSEHFMEEDFYYVKSGLKRIKDKVMPKATEKSDYLDAPASRRVCRICLRVDSKMYNIKEHNLAQAFELVIGRQVYEEDGLPQMVCWECAHRLQGWARFRGIAQTSQELMCTALTTGTYLTIRDIKSITRQHNLASPLVTTHLEPNEYDVFIKDNLVLIKAEETVDEQMMPEDNDDEMEIKDEQPTESEIFFEEFPDHFESDDDKKLSEVISEKKVKVRNREKKKKRKVEKEERPKKVRVKKSESQMEDEENPSSTLDKYKVSDVKRRKTQDALDETLFTITTLTYDEQIAEIEKRQESTNYKSAPFKCTVCYRGFIIKDRYDAHVLRHSEASGAFECFICKTRLKTARALRKHLTAQHTEKFSCKGCPFVTRNRGVAREHEKWHAGTKYQCPHCPAYFHKLTTYMGHIRIKHVSDFVCELCGYTFVSRKGIDVHKKKKHRLDDQQIPEDGPYCEVCDVKFVSEEAHSRHLKLSSRHSSDNDPNRIRNDSQSINAAKNGRVRKIERRPVIHPRDTSRPDAGPVTCEQCGVQLRDLRLYAQHFRRAHPDKNRTKYPAMKTPCMCEFCGRIFQSVSLLRDHMWVHTGEKRFKCDRCDKSFTQRTNLVFHMRVHSSARPTYECPLCGKQFAFYNNRRRHMFIHTGLKPFKCDTCGKCFTTAGEQRAHYEHVHLKKPWPKRARARHDHAWGHKDAQLED